MEFSDIDIPEMEKQRYRAIKRTNKYAEVDILVGAESDDLGGGLVSKSPVVSTHFHNCSAQEVGCLYMTLCEIAKTLEKTYPAECFASKIAMRIEDIGAVEYDEDEEE